MPIFIVYTFVVAMVEVPLPARNELYHGKKHCMKAHRFHIHFKSCSRHNYDINL